MDDFANMLIAKHESALYQSNENNESSYIPPINTANDSYFSVTSPKNQQSSSEKKEKSLLRTKRTQERSTFYCDSVRATTTHALVDCVMDESVHIQLPLTVSVQHDALKIIVGKDSKLQ